VFAGGSIGRACAGGMDFSDVRQWRRSRDRGGPQRRPDGHSTNRHSDVRAARRWSDGPSSRRADREGYGDHVFADADGSFATGGGQVRGRHFSGMIPDYDGVEGVHRACE
jgi:hypothetical protein